jgi:hypothetical protein
MTEVFESQPKDGLFLLNGLVFQLVQKFGTRLDFAVDLPAKGVVDLTKACIAGVKKASGLKQLPPEAVKLLDEMAAILARPGSVDSKAHDICQLCIQICTAEGLFGRLYNTVNELLRSFTRFVGHEADAILQQIESSCGDLYPFVRLAWMGLKTTFKLGGGKPTDIYRGMRISDAALASYEAAALPGDFVMLAPFMSFSTDVNEALKFPLDSTSKAGFTTVLLQLESMGRTPIHEFSKYAKEKEVLLPPCQILKVVRVTRFGDHGRVQIVLRDLGVAIETEFLTQARQPAPSAQVQFQFEYAGNRDSELLPAQVLDASNALSQAVKWREGRYWVHGLVFNAGKSVSSITMPQNITSIGDRAFESCTALSSITRKILTSNAQNPIQPTQR